MVKPRKNKPKNGLKDIHVYIPAYLYAIISEDAEMENRSITGQVRHMLQEKYGAIEF